MTISAFVALPRLKSGRKMVDMIWLTPGDGMVWRRVDGCPSYCCCAIVSSWIWCGEGRRGSLTLRCRNDIRGGPRNPETPSTLPLCPSAGPYNWRNESLRSSTLSWCGRSRRWLLPWFKGKLPYGKSTFPGREQRESQRRWKIRDREKGGGGRGLGRQRRKGVLLAWSILWSVTVSNKKRMGPCTLHHWVQSSMEAILACHPAVFRQWLAGWQFPVYSPHWSEKKKNQKSNRKNVSVHSIYWR